jgi:hypothetical protein
MKQKALPDRDGRSSAIWATLLSPKGSFFGAAAMLDFALITDRLMCAGSDEGLGSGRGLIY